MPAATAARRMAASSGLSVTALRTASSGIRISMDGGAAPIARVQTGVAALRRVEGGLLARREESAASGGSECAGYRIGALHSRRARAPASARYAGY